MAMYMWIQKLKPFILVVFLQLGLAGMDIICKAALNEGTSNYMLVVYRRAVATIVVMPLAVILNRTTRPKMTLPIFIRLMALGLLEPVIDQNLYYLGMKHTTATFGDAMANILPAITFVMACIMRLETVKMRSIRSQAKVFGTIATVAGVKNHKRNEDVADSTRKERDEVNSKTSSFTCPTMSETLPLQNRHSVLCI